MRRMPIVLGQAWPATQLDMHVVHRAVGRHAMVVGAILHGTRFLIAPSIDEQKLAVGRAPEPHRCISCGRRGCCGCCLVWG